MSETSKYGGGWYVSLGVIIENRGGSEKSNCFNFASSPPGHAVVADAAADVVVVAVMYFDYFPSKIFRHIVVQ